MAGLQRCLNCGHTDDFSLTNFICPNCDVELELLPGEMDMTTIALCTLKGGTYNHVWRHVSSLLAQPLVGGKALWQCGDCHRMVEGRQLDLKEAEKHSKGEDVIVQSIEAP